MNESHGARERSTRPGLRAALLPAPLLTTRTPPFAERPSWEGRRCPQWGPPVPHVCPSCHEGVGHPTPPAPRASGVEGQRGLTRFSRMEPTVRGEGGLLSRRSPLQRNAKMAPISVSLCRRLEPRPLQSQRSHGPGSSQNYPLPPTGHLEPCRQITACFLRIRDRRESLSPTNVFRRSPEQLGP